MTKEDRDAAGVTRRGALECMIWAGTGVLWTVSGGVPHSSLLTGAAAATPASGGLSFLQISDSHVGFDKPANPNALGTLQEAIGLVKAMPNKPAFMIHTGDISHLSKASQFDDADQAIGAAGLQVHYVPGEHDMIDEDAGKLYLERYGKQAKGAGWYSYDVQGRALHWPGQRRRPQGGRDGQSRRGPTRLVGRRPERPLRLRPRSWCSHISRFGHSTRPGAGERPMPSRRSVCCGGSARSRS